MGEMADAIVDQFSASPGFRYYPRAAQREVVTFELGKDDVDELTHPLEPQQCSTFGQLMEHRQSWNNRTPPCASPNLWYIANSGHDDGTTLEQKRIRDKWRELAGLLPSAFFAHNTVG